MPISYPMTYVSKIAGKTGYQQNTGTAISILREARQKRFSAGKALWA